MGHFRKYILYIIVWSIVLVDVQTLHAVSVRIKDIVNFEGIRKNQLIGYGLVIGLNGTGDDANTPFTQESTVSMLERLGVSIREEKANLKGKNVAAVIVTADLPPFVRHGTQIDVSVSSLGNAKSLHGGILLCVSLRCAHEIPGVLHCCR